MRESIDDFVSNARIGAKLAVDAPFLVFVVTPLALLIGGCQKFYEVLQNA